MAEHVARVESPRSNAHPVGIARHVPRRGMEERGYGRAKIGEQHFHSGLRESSLLLYVITANGTSHELAESRRCLWGEDVTQSPVPRDETKSGSKRNGR